MTKVPKRRLNTFFLGAGFSRSVGLPNTAELLTEVHEHSDWYNKSVGEKLRDAYQYFYPEEAKTFIPEVVDFFAVLRANKEISQGMPGAFRHSSLLKELRMTITQILCERLRNYEIPDEGWPAVDEILKPGNTVITSNWDIFLEYYCRRRAIPLKIGGDPSPDYVTLLKLHGSIDWTTNKSCKKSPNPGEYAPLRELQNPNRQYRISQLSDETVLRIRAVENMSKCWQYIKARTQDPLMVTMAFGKAAEIAPIKSMWDGAYYALSASKTLHIIGYSLPDDDVEIRTLLRAGVARGSSSKIDVYVVNPEPRVHSRVRTLISQHASADYRSFNPAEKSIISKSPRRQ